MGGLLKSVMLGVDIGGTNTKFGLAEKNGEFHYESSIPTDAGKPANQLFKRLQENLFGFLKSHSNTFEIKGAGIGVPNANYYTGITDNPPNLKWGRVNVVELVKKRFNLPVVITNDANACALGEMWFGAACGMKDFVNITLGTGLGSGIVVGGHLVYGANGMAGELGHTVIEPYGRICACGKHGCLEAYVSATGIVRTSIELLAKYTIDSELRNLSVNEISAHLLHDLALKGDKIAIEAFDITAKLLGRALANTVMFSSPEAIFIGGGLASAVDQIFEPTRKYMEENLLPSFRNQVKILPTGLTVNPAVLGAAALAWNELGDE